MLKIMTEVSRLPNPADYPNGAYVKMVKEDGTVVGIFCRCGDWDRPFWQNVNGDTVCNKNID